MKNIHDEKTHKRMEEMVDGIVGKESPNPTAHEKETRKRLSGRAAEYFMFLDDEEQDDEK